MSARFSKGSWRIDYSSRRRSVSSPAPPRRSWDTSSRQGVLAWTLRRFEQWRREEWPKPTDRKALQHFLGFPNFYRRFIWNYSMIALALTRLTSTKVHFSWDQKADEAFRELKKWFTTAPILIHPDPQSQFIVEMDASNVGVGAILSQRSARESKVHPCAFYSHRLSPAEQNYISRLRFCLIPVCFWFLDRT